MRATKSELTKTTDTEEMTIYEGTWGDMLVRYLVFNKRFDVTPYLKGLPDDLDPCPHWGTVVNGQITLRYDGREETVTSGDAYYAEPGHTAIVEAGTEYWEFSPADMMRKTEKVVTNNMKAMVPKQR